MRLFTELLATACATIFLQNLIFTGGYGADEAMRLSIKPRRLFGFCVMLAAFSIITSLVCRVLNLIPTINALSSTMHAVVYALVLVAIYLIVSSLIAMILKPPQKFLSMLGMAALNTLVLAVPLLNRRAGHTIAQSVVTGLGSALAFMLASMLLHVGMQRQENNREIPTSFLGTPAAFIYLALLSMAFMGFTGRTLFA